MILYHGSYLEVQTPDLVHSRENLDFGRGFYTTPLYEQAIKWCERFKRRGKRGIVSHYSSEMQKGNDATDYDIVIGGAANDKVFNTVELYFDNLIDKKEAIHRLRYEKLNLQMCLRTQTVLDEYLHYEGSEQI